jgi:hypothetical protein
LAILAMGVFGRFAAMKTAPGTVNLLPPVRLLRVELRQAGEQFPVWTARSRIAARTRPA